MLLIIIKYLITHCVVYYSDRHSKFTFFVIVLTPGDVAGLMNFDISFTRINVANVSGLGR